MRKYLKARCLEILKVLEEAHGELIDLIERKDTAAALDTLSQCQQGAVSVGEAIEDSEGEGTEEVHLLEEYCEALWRVSEDLSAGRIAGFREEARGLDLMLKSVSKGIESRIPTQREVVFLPYKASMWDSLESVWKRLSEDPAVNAIVMPIPYFDKKPDGTVREMHYEADQFPEYVPVADYHHYDLEEKHPEAVYIHNPYDEANHVTTVHPDYYSSRLKNLTDELIYIPYFFLQEIDPDDQQTVRAFEHFITVPGVMNAHRVIVQSEAWRKAYIDVMTRYTGEKTRSYWEHKIEAGKSPKIERLEEMMKSDISLPDDWHSVISKPDGKRKKIIFYNTVVTAMLANREAMIEKICRVLEVFKENAGEVALLWRPHPLMEATIASMAPELSERYRILVDNFRREGWGIYDDSPDLDRAIVVSDAYYGDLSSVVWLFKETGKPVMIQNCDV